MLEQETDFADPQARGKAASKITDTPEPKRDSPDKMAVAKSATYPPEKVFSNKNHTLIHLDM